MRFLKTMSIRTRYLIFNILMTIGGVFLAAKILVDLFTDDLQLFLNWSLAIGLVFFAIGFVFRLTIVKCPLCGKKIEDQKAPLYCPHCKESAYMSGQIEETNQ